MARPPALSWFFSLIVLSSCTCKAAADGPHDFFERKIRPVLVEKCVSCHGPKSQKGGLRLDSKAGLLQGGANGPVVSTEDPQASTLIEVLTYETETRMPPKGKLDDAAISDFKTWIKHGAAWPDQPITASKDETPQLWALQPVARPASPAIKLANWPQTSVDAFILARLEPQGLSPAPKVDRRTLLRRWCYTLTGLPPTPEEVEAFERDNRPDAEARTVDRLLTSPHYGERWGRHWLDIARYADTKGYVFFEDAGYPWAYTYRDYVIRAFNNDLPYDRFIIEQLAADKLDLGTDRRALTALGFVTVGGRFMNNVQDILDDRIDATTRGLLGLTVACARCHDHKFDPIPTADYYSLYSVFASSVEPPIPPLFETPPDTAEYRKFDTELKKREDALEAFLFDKYTALINSSKTRATEYLLAARAARNKPKTDDFMLLADTNDINPLMITRWRAMLDRMRRGHDPVFAIWNALSDLDDDTFKAKAAETLAKLIQSGKPLNAAILNAINTAPPQSPAELAAIYSKWLNRADMIVAESAERARLNRTPRSPSPIEGLDELSQVFQGPDSPSSLARSSIDNLALVPDRASQATLTALTKAVESWRATGPGAPPRAMSLVDLPQPISSRVFLRGNQNTPGPTVTRHNLSLFGPAPEFKNGSGRLELAQAVANRSNPLTARVFVNRVWMNHFGTPLVSTPSDFGARSSPPSHPELLDHLASTFMDEGWSMKALHRRILLSSTFAQSSDASPHARRVDPANLLYSRMNRRRLDWESMRDYMLAHAGKLDRTVGGRSMSDLFAANANRRTLYGSIDRLNLPGIYRTFDFPDPNSSNPLRVETSVPPQALFFMNHPVVRESARAIRQRSDIQKCATVEEKLIRLYAVLFNRTPEPRELAALRNALGGSSPSAEEWDRMIQAILQSNEFVFVD